MKPHILIVALLALLLLSPIVALAEEATEAEEALAYSRVIDVPGAGPLQYYAQNDPIWARSLYEPYKSSHYRPFKDTGCGPSAAAMAIARQLDVESLPDLINSARDPEKGFPYCVCSVNGYRCDRSHELTTPTTGEDFLTHLPIIFASYAAGNNESQTKYRTEITATSISVFSSLAEAYGLHYKGVRDWEKARVALEAGCSVITTVSKGIFTPASHYLFIASVHDGYVYVLDSFLREDYDELDRRHILEVVEPGLVRASLNDLNRLGFSGFYIISDEEIPLE